MTTSQELAKAVVLAKQEAVFDRLIQIDCYDVDDEVERNSVICDLKYLYLYYNYLNEATLTDDEVASVLYNLYDITISTTSLDVLQSITIDTVLGIPDLNNAQGITNINLSAYVNKNSDIGTGIIYDAIIDKIKLDTDTTILVAPLIVIGEYENDGITVPEAIWEIYKNDGVTSYIVSISNDKDLITEKGNKVKLSARFSYPLASAGESLPTGISGNFGNVLPAPTIYSEDITNDGEFIISDIVKTVTLSKPKTGLIIQGGQIIPATGIDTQSDSISISFKDASYYGVSTSASLNEAAILALSNIFLDTDKNVIINNITTTNQQYFYYCYPTEYGDLTGVLLNGGSVINGAFIKLGTIEITTRAGILKTLNIYRTVDLGAFTSDDVTFM